MDNAGATKPTFLWRGILILLPVALLAGLGLYSLHQDRLLAEVEARRQCQDLAERMAESVFNQLPKALLNPAEPRWPAAIIIDKNGGLREIDGSRERAKLPRDPTPRAWPVGLLDREQAEAWQAARRAEFSGAAAIPLWRKFIGLAPPPPFLAQACYDLGLLLVSQGQAGADQLFSQVEEDRNAETESGLPLWLLAEFQRARLAPGLAAYVFRDAVNHPSLAAPVIFASLPQSRVNQAWKDAWQSDEAARDFYQRVRPALEADPGGQPFWTAWDGAAWLTLRVPGTNAESGLVPVQRDLVEEGLAYIIRSGPVPPGYAELGIEIAGRPMLMASGPWPVLASATNGFVSVREGLSRPGVLYAQQRLRTVWFAALILVSAVAALVGFVSAYRGFHQQLRLSEMKSNFVSSVSHELRAPIASMRLMAESLERGKIADSVKQKEYFGFLVQESRRLSSLIENILDFSRIEQGRKEYRFEPTDLEALLAQTLRLMQPYAAERGVALQWQKTELIESPLIECDGLAMQQAVINLIDNAVKHSPNGGVVTLGLECGPGGARLWVEDQGPGIPAAEQGRIFELFYRRGTELRRETQGIGIGLTIVKYSVEAHGGRVSVRSAVGEGSRFTIELPPRPSLRAET